MSTPTIEKPAIYRSFEDLEVYSIDCPERTIILGQSLCAYDGHRMIIVEHDLFIKGGPRESKLPPTLSQGSWTVDTMIPDVNI